MPATPSNYKPMDRTERRAAQGSRRIGPADPKEKLSVSIRVRRRSGAPSISNSPSGPSLVHTTSALSREEFAAHYGADSADLERVIQFARQHGLQIIESSIPRRTVSVSGTVSQMNLAFGVDLGHYESPHGTYRGREGQVNVPANLHSIVEGVFGLDNRKMAAPLNVVGPAQAIAPLSPTQVASLYDFPPVSRNAGTQTIGILEFGGGFNLSDITAFFQAQKLPTPAITVVGVDGATNAPGGQDDVEVTLDIDVAGSVVPGAQLAVYFTPWTEQGWVDVVTTAIHDAKNKPSVISISWGWPENETIGSLTWTQAAIDAVSATFQEAALLGVTVLVASGDNGSSCGLAGGKALVLYPASDPWVTTCGGTSISTTSATSFTETTWNDNGVTGGGISVIFPPQPWQTWAKVPHSANPGGHVGRGIPDIAGNADPDSGYAIIVNGAANGTVGGTSAVAPLYAGLVAISNATLGKPAGYLNTNLYAYAATDVYRDIADGKSNATNGAPGYTSGRGWDACTGFGSVNGTALMCALAGIGLPVALAEFQNNLYMAWNQQEQVYYSTVANAIWSPQQQVPGLKTSTGTALATLGGKLYLACKGGSGDQNIYYATFDGSSWSTQQQIKGIATGTGPQLAVLGKNLYMAWKGVEGDQRIYWNQFDGSNWSGQQQLPGAGSSFGPSLAAVNNVLYASWKGVYGDPGAYYSVFNGTKWSAQARVTGITTTDGPSLASFNNSLFAIWKSEFKDQSLWYSCFDGKTWQAQKQLPGSVSNGGAGLAGFGTSLFAVWKATGSNNAVCYSVFDGTTWSAPKQAVGK